MLMMGRLPTLSRLLKPHPLSPVRRSCTRAGCPANTSGSGTPTLQMLSGDMQDWMLELRTERRTERKEFDAERKEFDAERREFYRQEMLQAIRIAELKKDAMRMLDERVRFREGFNVRSGLERICYQAILEDRIKHPGWGVQRQLNRLATTPEFCAIYAREIAARRLTLSDVEHCRKDIYHTLAKHAYGNERTILIRTSDFTPSEVTAVVTYYKMQDAWGDDALVWMEVGAKE